MDTKRNNLFRLTRKKSELLESILHVVEGDMRRCDDISMARYYIEENESLTQKEKDEKIMVLDEKLEKLYLYHDVLRIVFYHSKEWLRKPTMRRVREWDNEWDNEWDIPLDVFNTVIDETKTILLWHQGHVYPTPQKEFDEQLTLLKDLKNFRNNV